MPQNDDQDTDPCPMAQAMLEFSQTVKTALNSFHQRIALLESVLVDEGFIEPDDRPENPIPDSGPVSFPDLMHGWAEAAIRMHADANPADWVSLEIQLITNPETLKSIVTATHRPTGYSRWCPIDPTDPESIRTKVNELAQLVRSHVTADPFKGSDDHCPSCKAHPSWIGNPDSDYCTDSWHG